VVVNFSDAAYTLPDSQIVKPRDYVMFRKDKAGRAYPPPPCPNVFVE
jgi:hypothetical protein